jgi:integrase/recombinase XerD
MKAKPVPVSQVIEELLRAKTAANRRPVYVRTLRFYLAMFARGREDKPIGSFKRADIVQWFESRNDSPASRRTGIQLLSVLFAHAQRVGYTTENPASKFETVTVDRKPPRILSPAECRKLMLYAKRNMRWRVPQLALCLYAGIRPTEVSKLTWNDIDLDRGFVRIDAHVSKIRRRRIVRLEPKCIAWLKWAKPQVNPKRRIGWLSPRWKQRLAEHCGFRWIPDLLRHCAASYWLALRNDVGFVSRMLGNRPSVLLNHYTELVTPEDCRRFWKMPSLRPGKVHPGHQSADPHVSTMAGMFTHSAAQAIVIAV